MKANEILTALKLPKSKENNTHAKALSDIYDFFKKIKPEIVSSSMADVGMMRFGMKTEVFRYLNGAWQERVLNEGKEVRASKIVVHTANGKYTATIPNVDPIRFNFMSLLGLTDKN